MTMPDILSIHRPEEGRVVLSLKIDAGLPAFDGHFPGCPILPGVVQLDWAMRLAGRYLGLKQRVADDFQVKFRHTIVPNSAVTLSLGLDDVRHRLNFEYRLGDEIASSGRIRLEPQP